VRTAAVVIGAGHAGLAVSRVLADRGIDHVVLERGDVANSWKTERWDSLRLLTPNWQTKLPGAAYDGDDPDGFMSMPAVVDFIERYATANDAPVRTHTTVTSIDAADDGGYQVETTTGTWSAPAVVIASGACNRASIPSAAADLPATIRQITPLEYRRPDDVGPGRVLVVGASATGVQLAEELLGSGREVTVAVGEHVRMPRTYRGHDIFWWMDRTGRQDERWDEVDDLVRARHVPSPQLVGTPQRTDLDLNALSARGAEIVGRLSAVRDDTAYFSGSLRNVCQLADLKQRRLLDAFDEWAVESGYAAADGPRPKPTRVEDDPRLSINLGTEGYETVLWATGFRPDHSWLHVPAFDRKGQLRDDGGVVPAAPGLYRIGLPFQRRRKSSFIHGAEDDATDLVEHLAGHLAGGGR
jgi:putative flavoprotein involved in K+ transport